MRPYLNGFKIKIRSINLILSQNRVMIFTQIIFVTDGLHFLS